MTFIFLQNPEDMIAGELAPPGVFLNASAVLERQFTAFCMDCWVEPGFPKGPCPDSSGMSWAILKTVDPNKFPHNLLQFVENHRTDLFERFIKIFDPSLSKDSILHLKHFVEGNRDSQGGAFLPGLSMGFIFILKNANPLKKR